MAGGILLTLIGVLWAIRARPSQVAQPTPPLADLLLRKSDLADRGFECELVERDAEEMAKEMAQFTGLSPDYLEGQGVYFLVYSPPPRPKAVTHGVYRYESEEEAIAHYEHLLEALPLAPLGRETPIISWSEQSSKGIKGQILEAQDPIGIAYCFFGVRGKLLTIMEVLGTESTGQPVFEKLLPIALQRMAEPQ